MHKSDNVKDVIERDVYRLEDNGLDADKVFVADWCSVDVTVVVAL